MSSLRPLSPGVWAAPQVSLEALSDLAASGVRTLVNNRHDGEDPGQPTSEEMQAAALAAGLNYVHAPVSGMPGPDTIQRVATILEQDEPVVLYCRSGTRSTVAWALAMRALDRARPEELREVAARAGYDLSHLPL